LSISHSISATQNASVENGRKLDANQEDVKKLVQANEAK
jgi:hypothetical protein